MPVKDDGQMAHRLLLLVLFAATTAGATTIDDATATQHIFWTSTRLVSMEWRDQCITTAQCSKPRFQIVEDMAAADERHATGWSVKDNGVEDSARPIVSAWSKGAAAEWTIAAQVVGVDPAYGFPRVCDETHLQRPFFQPEPHKDIRRRLEPSDSEEPTRLVLRSKCLNVTVDVQLHTRRCPWCPDPSAIAASESAVLVGQDCVESAAIAWIDGTGASHPVVVALLGALTLLSTLASCVLAVSLRRQRRRERKRDRLVQRGAHLRGGGGSTPFIGHHPQQLLIAKELDEGRYDLPWEQQCQHHGQQHHHHHLLTSSTTVRPYATTNGRSMGRWSSGNVRSDTTTSTTAGGPAMLQNHGSTVSPTIESSASSLGAVTTAGTQPYALLPAPPLPIGPPPPALAARLFESLSASQPQALPSTSPPPPPLTFGTSQFNRSHVRLSNGGGGRVGSQRQIYETMRVPTVAAVTQPLSHQQQQPAVVDLLDDSGHDSV